MNEVIPLNRRLYSFLINRRTHFLQIPLTFIPTPCANTLEITLQNNKRIRFDETFNNTIHTGAAQADVTTAAVNVIMSHTTHFL